MAVVLTNTHRVKTRKDHVCQGCGKTMPKGSECYSTSIAGDGTAYTLYECEECRDYYIENCDGCKDFEYCLGENYQVGAIRRCRQENGVRDDFLPAALGGGTREN